MKRKIKNTILKGLAWFNAVLFLVAATAADSMSNIPKIVMFTTLAYLLLFMYVNRHTRITVQDTICGWGE